MRRGPLSRPAREQPLAVAGLGLALAAAIVVTLLLPVHQHAPTAPRKTPVASTALASTTRAAIVGRRPPPPAVTASQRAAATRAARRFLVSYLPVLYARRPARTIVDADAHVRAELAAVARSPRAPRNRHPRIRGLTSHTQSDGEVITIALIDDEVQKPYQLVCQLTNRHGRWRVSELSNY